MGDVMTWLLEHPPVRDQFRTVRRETESGVVVIHTAENTPDTVATDGGAEAVAEFIRTRSTPGSYHVLADSDSRLQLLPWTCEAYQDGTGSNPHAVGLSIATRADWWPWAPQGWRDGAIEHLAQAAAEYALWLYEKRGIRIPARRITRAESDRRIPGFISHAERDPDRRTDPGGQFPWTQFLGRFAELTSQEDDMPTHEQLVAAVEDALGQALKTSPVGKGQTSWGGTIKATLAGVQANANRLGAIARAVNAVDADIDSLQLILGGMSPSEIVESMTAAGIADAVADELDRRARERLGDG